MPKVGATYIGRPCKRGHDGTRYKCDRKCVKCRALYFQANRERFGAQCRRWLRENPERWAAFFSKWRETHGEQDRRNSSRWEKENRPRANATLAKRKASQLARTPSWSDLSAIAEVYQRCGRVGKETGVPHEVDHIIPLQGKNVSGLHVPWNLQIIPRIENRKKGNRLLHG